MFIALNSYSITSSHQQQSNHDRPRNEFIGSSPISSTTSSPSTLLISGGETSTSTTTTTSTATATCYTKNSLPHMPAQTASPVLTTTPRPPSAPLIFSSSITVQNQQHQSSQQSQNKSKNESSNHMSNGNGINGVSLANSSSVSIGNPMNGYNNNNNFNSNSSMPYRKQSVFVAPAGLNWIINENINNNHNINNNGPTKLAANSFNPPPPPPCSSSSNKIVATTTTITTTSSSALLISNIKRENSVGSSRSSSSSSSSNNSSGSNSPSIPNTNTSPIPQINPATAATGVDCSSSSVLPILPATISTTLPSDSSTSNSSSLTTVSSPSSLSSSSSSLLLQSKINLHEIKKDEIEEHISKIISQNAAIVETLDPLWSKRYLSRHSVSSVPTGHHHFSPSSSSPNFSATSSSTSTSVQNSFSSSISSNILFNPAESASHSSSHSALPSRRFSEIIVDPTSRSASKLQSALLGKVYPTTAAVTVITSCAKTIPLSNLKSSGNSSSSSSINLYTSSTGNLHHRLSATYSHDLLNNNNNIIANELHQPTATRRHSEFIYPSVIKVNPKNPSTHTNSNGNGSNSGSISSLSASTFCSIKKDDDSPSLVRNLLTSSKSNQTPAATTITSCATSVPSVRVISVPDKLPVTMPIVDIPINGKTLSSIDGNNAHPENPEGSIIKDLLLKARDDGDGRRLSRSSLVSPVNHDELTMLVYVCTICKIAFRNRETLEAHQLHYCKANETSHSNETSSNQLQLLNDHVQRKISVMESNFLQHQLTRPMPSHRNYHLNQQQQQQQQPQQILPQQQPLNVSSISSANASITTSPAASTSHKVELGTSITSSSPHQSVTSAPPIGNILKQQLLSPFQGPPLKKRKSSEPVFSKSNQLYQSHSHSHQMVTSLPTPGQIVRKISSSSSLTPQNNNHLPTVTASATTSASSSLSTMNTQPQAAIFNRMPTVNNTVRWNSEHNGHDTITISITSNTTGTKLLAQTFPSSSTIQNDNRPVVLQPQFSLSPTTTLTSSTPSPLSPSSSLSLPIPIVSSSLSTASQSTLSNSNNDQIDQGFSSTDIKLDILADYYPHLKCPETKITLKGPLLFPVLRTILSGNSDNVEFQVQDEVPRFPFCNDNHTKGVIDSDKSMDDSSSGVVVATISDSNQFNRYISYKQVPSLPDLQEVSTQPTQQSGDDVVSIKEKLKSYDQPTNGDDGGDESGEMEDKNVGEARNLGKNRVVNDSTAAYSISNSNGNLSDHDVSEGNTSIACGETSLAGDSQRDGDSGQSVSITIASDLCNSTGGEQCSSDSAVSVELDTLDLTMTEKTSSSSSMLTSIASSVKGNGMVSLSTNYRPNSLPLKKKSLQAFRLIGSTLVSPDEPRPMRKCQHFSINGSAYTHLGLKLTTRSTFCCIYRPQPMYVPQEAKSKLSMYSNWQISPPHDDIFTLVEPGQLFDAYETRQWRLEPCSVRFTFAPSSLEKLLANFTCSPSAYWIQKKRDELNSPESTTTTTTTPLTTTNTISLEVVNNNNNNKRKTMEAYHPLYNESSLELNSVTPRKTSEDRLSNMSSGFESENSNDPNQPKRVKIFEGGFKSNEDYTYVRGRGRGKYVCEECGIRCKKPSMLKKHIRTHTDLRPYSCRHCAFAFKTKGNLTKHMKSKAHHKKCVELGIIPVPTAIDESQIDCEALAKQEAIERTYGGGTLASDDEENDPDDEDGCEDDEEDMSDDEGVPIPIITATGNPFAERNMMEFESIAEKQVPSHRKSIIMANEMDEQEVARSLLVLSGSGEWSTSLPTISETAHQGSTPSAPLALADTPTSAFVAPVATRSNPSIAMVGETASAFGSLGHYNQPLQPPLGSEAKLEKPDLLQSTENSSRGHFYNPCTWTSSLNSFSRQRSYSFNDGLIRNFPITSPSTSTHPDNSSISSITCRQVEKTLEKSSNPIIETISTDESNDSESDDYSVRRYSMSVIPDRSMFSAFNSGSSYGLPANNPYQTNSRDSHSSSTRGDHGQTMDELPIFMRPRAGTIGSCSATSIAEEEGPIDLSKRKNAFDLFPSGSSSGSHQKIISSIGGRQKSVTGFGNLSRDISRTFSTSSCMGNDSFSGFLASPQSIINHNDEGKAVCRTCNKTFSKLSQLRIHVNIHYMERPYRCDSCGVSFRTKGHLQKHERSVSHFNKVNINMTFGTPTTDNPRPFKCDDCIIAFRIHGHLAKHLRSKAHIMKLECSGKLPCGMYADMERFGISLNEIDTNDCENSLQSLQQMAEKMYSKNGEVDLSWLKSSGSNPVSNGNHSIADPPSDPSGSGEEDMNSEGNDGQPIKGNLKNHETCQPDFLPIQRSYSFSEPSSHYQSLQNSPSATKRFSFSNPNRLKSPNSSPSVSSRNIYSHTSNLPYFQDKDSNSSFMKSIYYTGKVNGDESRASSRLRPYNSSENSDSDPVQLARTITPSLGSFSQSSITPISSNLLSSTLTNPSSHLSNQYFDCNSKLVVTSAPFNACTSTASPSNSSPSVIPVEENYSYPPASNVSSSSSLSSLSSLPVKNAILGSNSIDKTAARLLTTSFPSTPSQNFGSTSLSNSSSPTVASPPDNCGSSENNVNGTSNNLISTSANNHSLSNSQSKITSIRSNTCHLCNQVFKSAKFLQVHLYCDHQQQKSTSPMVVCKDNGSLDPNYSNQNHNDNNNNDLTVR
ncbi:uncharacterized protein LOC141854430 [Brevipalpus obovatus]|uniref:uncharacterized protein LOC141854430 n=1 Tax=Brevipalpus obovatus TaxID=246614 RepID=UPI003D9E2CC9